VAEKKPNIKAVALPPQGDAHSCGLWSSNIKADSANTTDMDYKRCCVHHPFWLVVRGEPAFELNHASQTN